MPSLNIYIVLAIGISFILVGILFSQNVRVVRKRRRRKLPRMQKGDNKDWQAVSLQLEKHIYSLRKEIDALEKKGKNVEKELMIEKQKYAKSQEKLSQERGWKKKESSDSMDRDISPSTFRLSLGYLKLTRSKERPFLMG